MAPNSRFCEHVGVSFNLILSPPQPVRLLVLNSGGLGTKASYQKSRLIGNLDVVIYLGNVMENNYYFGENSKYN